MLREEEICYLAAMVQQGNQQAAHELKQLVEPVVVRMVLRSMGGRPHSDIDEVIANVFVEVLVKNIGRLATGEVRPVNSWFRAVAETQANAYFRKMYNSYKLSGGETAECLGERIDSKNVIEELVEEEAIRVFERRLTVEQARIVEMVISGYSPREIQEALGINANVYQRRIRTIRTRYLMVHRERDVPPEMG